VTAQLQSKKSEEKSARTSICKQKKPITHSWTTASQQSTTLLALTRETIGGFKVACPKKKMTLKSFLTSRQLLANSCHSTPSWVRKNPLLPPHDYPGLHARRLDWTRTWLSSKRMLLRLRDRDWLKPLALLKVPITAATLVGFQQHSPIFRHHQPHSKHLRTTIASQKLNFLM